MTQTVLVTRPRIEAETTAADLERRGCDALIAPMVEVQPASFELPEETRSLIVTSKNGARHGLSMIPQKGRPVYAVGQATADECKRLGFTNVSVGPGTAKGLIPVLSESGIKVKRQYTWLSGEDTAYDIAGVLQNQGIDAERLVTYRTRAAQGFPTDVTVALDQGDVDAVLFYSARAATIFEELVSELEKTWWLKKLDAITMSARVSDNLIGPWASIRHAVLPTELSLFKLLG
ncbi:uroporphyrinogen-III synthase [Yunchengibacter salinarum]|uniref:uroporphyrinogen-III synthase n=1 Tax=Yunchengibacter salinarum TaxID=3133399 RepID=UPI0035B6743C